MSPICFGGTPALKRWPTTGTLAEHLGMELVEAGDGFLTGRMPVDHRHRQPFGQLHGGASVALAETLMSYAANLCLDPDKQYGVGLEINANHVRAVREGWSPAPRGRCTEARPPQVWTCDIPDEAGCLVCSSRMTIAVLDRKLPVA